MSRTTAIFIEPTGELHATILAAKEWMQDRWPSATYLSHPPHCTLMHGSYGEESAWLEALRTRVAQCDAFRAETSGWIEFPADALAGGGTTMALGLERTSPLADLQIAIAECLAPFARQASGHPLAGREPFASSLRRFGSPFVGAHWIPHLTIGSPRVRPDDPRLMELKARPAAFSCQVDRVSVWAVDGDAHERRQELALRPRGSRTSGHAATS